VWEDYSAEKYCRAVGFSVNKLAGVDIPSSPLKNGLCRQSLIPTLFTCLSTCKSFYVCVCLFVWVCMTHDWTLLPWTYVYVRERSNLESKREIWIRANCDSHAVYSKWCVTLYRVVWAATKAHTSYPCWSMLPASLLCLYVCLHVNRCLYVRCSCYHEHSRVMDYLGQRMTHVTRTYHCHSDSLNWAFVNRTNWHLLIFCIWRTGTWLDRYVVCKLLVTVP